jgi:neutral ceramidase
MAQKFNSHVDATTNMSRGSARKSRQYGRSSRRAILAAGVAFATTAAAGRFGRAAVMDDLLMGHASVDTTPPNGIELAGFHRTPGNPRLITGSRQPAAARVLVLEKGPVKAAIVVLDIIAVSAEFARRFARAVEDRLGIAADHVRVCATHTHSMPTFLPLRQWGAVPEAYRSLVMERGLEAVERAWRDRSAARLLVGSSRVEGGNFNRTVEPGQARTDADFGPTSDDSERWLDTMLHALVFERTAGKPPIIAYHFSAHPVCFNDSLSGPDWAGVVAENCRATRGVDPLFLQGHSGDVNPGDGTKSIGALEPTARAISKGLDAALEAARETAIDRLDSIRQPVDLPLDLDLYREWLAAYRADPAACSEGTWIDAGFAAEWFQAARAAEDSPRALRTTLSSLRLGPVAMLFHPAELYSCYGLAIRRDSGAATTLCVGYTDDFVGYVTDPAAYARGEYASLTVPKVLDLPPFTTEAGRQLTAAATALLAARS